MTSATTSSTDTTKTTDTSTTKTVESNAPTKAFFDDRELVVIPDIFLTTVADVFALINRKVEAGQGLFDCLVVGGVSSMQKFNAIKAERDNSDHAARLSYLPDLAIAILTIPSKPHELAHTALFQELLHSIRGMGEHLRWTMYQATFFAGAPGSGSGEGDSAGGPFSKNEFRGQCWPTIVIESGISQSLAALRAKGRWWFAASDYHMKVVILVKFAIDSSTFTIEKWTAIPHEESGQRTGATNTRASTRPRTSLEPMCRQQLAVAWSGARPIRQVPKHERVAELFAVTGAPLVIQFEDLFLRPANAEHGEHDISFSRENIQKMAEVIWFDV